MVPDGRDFIQRNPDHDDAPTGRGGCAPVPITRVQLAITKPINLPLETFVGLESEAQANACLLDLCRRIPPASNGLHVAVIASFADGYEYHAVHRLHALEMDGTVRGHVLRVLHYLQSHPTYRLHYALGAQDLDALMVAVAGQPDQVRCADTLRQHAHMQRQRHALQRLAEQGMEDYYTHVLHRLDLGATAKAAVNLARQDAEAPLLPNRELPFQVPDAQDAEVLLGIHGAWKEAHHFLGQLPGAS